MTIWPFKRKQPQDVVDATQLPEEIQEYYESARKERVGVAWLLGLATVAVTVLVASGLYFGGRWVYKTASKKDKKPEQTSQQTNKPATDSKPKPDENKDKPAPAPTTTPKPTPAPTPAPQPTPAPAPTPAASRVPNTGPDEEL